MHLGTGVRAVLVSIAFLGAGMPVVVEASPLGAGAGTEWSAVADGATVTAFYGYGSLTSRLGSLALGGLHYDDGSITAAGPLAAAALLVAPSVSARAWWTQYRGAEGFRAWRIRGGPEWTLPRNATVGVFFAYLENAQGGIQRSGSLEIGMPIDAHWTGKLDAGSARLPGSITATQAALGVAWSPLARVELSGGIGLARNGAFLGTASTVGGGGGGLPLPLGLGGGGRGNGRTQSTAPVATTEPTLNLGLRVALP